MCGMIFFSTFGSSRRLRRSYKKKMVVEIDDDFLSRLEKEARENRGSCRPSGVGKMVFHFERVSLRLYPLALEDEEGKRKKRDG